MSSSHTPTIETFRTPGYGDIWKVRCNCCDWESHGIDPVGQEAQWRRAKNHRCDEDSE